MQWTLRDTIYGITRWIILGCSKSLFDVRNCAPYLEYSLCQGTWLFADPASGSWFHFYHSVSPVSSTWQRDFEIGLVPPVPHIRCYYQIRKRCIISKFCIRIRHENGHLQAEKERIFCLTFFFNATSICPCIANIFAEYNEQDATFSRFIYFCKTLYIFETWLRTAKPSETCRASYRNKLRKVASCWLYSGSILCLCAGCVQYLVSFASFLWT